MGVGCLLGYIYKKPSDDIETPDIHRAAPGRLPGGISQASECILAMTQSRSQVGNDLLDGTDPRS